MPTNNWGVPASGTSTDYQQGIFGPQPALGSNPYANAASSAASAANAATYTDPGVTGNNTTKPSTTSIAGGTNPMTGWAASQGFNPSELDSILYNSPYTLLKYVFPNMQTGGAGYSTLRNMPADPISLYNMIAGAQGLLTGANASGGGTGTGSGNYANWLRDLYTNYGSAGGRGFNTQELLRNIFSQNTDPNGGQKTSLAQLLGNGTADDQSRTLYNLVRDATNAGMNPLAAQGFQASMMNNLDNYQSQALSSNSSSIPNAVDYIRQNAPQLAGLF